MASDIVEAKGEIEKFIIRQPPMGEKDDYDKGRGSSLATQGSFSGERVRLADPSCIFVCCVLQCVACVLRCVAYVLQCVACVLQCVAVCCVCVVDPAICRAAKSSLSLFS